MIKDLFMEQLHELGITINESQERQFSIYFDLLIEWNSFMNLTAITIKEEVYLKHFIDSLSLIKAIPDLGSKNFRIIDVGTGAGFPGIPLKIAFPNLNITLLDSLNKRVNFLNEIISKLQLQDISAIHGRAEDYAKSKELREQFDLCVSRAVANLKTLSEYCLPFVKIDGYFIPYKSDKNNQEIEEAITAISKLGGTYDSYLEFSLPDTQIYRNLYLIKKTSKTPSRYPRKAGLPQKEPIC